MNAQELLAEFKTCDGQGDRSIAFRKMIAQAMTDTPAADDTDGKWKPYHMETVRMPRWLEQRLDAAAHEMRVSKNRLAMVALAVAISEIESAVAISEIESELFDVGKPTTDFEGKTPPEKYQC